MGCRKTNTLKEERQLSDSRQAIAEGDADVKVGRTNEYAPGKLVACLKKAP